DHDFVRRDSWIRHRGICLTGTIPANRSRADYHVSHPDSLLDTSRGAQTQERMAPYGRQLVDGDLSRRSANSRGAGANRDTTVGTPRRSILTVVRDLLLFLPGRRQNRNSTWITG